jgi:hypothetical protein
LPTANCQPDSYRVNYWQQEVNYIIDVTLNDKDHTLDAFEKLEYSNHSPDTLKFIWFHLWPNAYKNDKTAFCDQRLENGDTKFYFSDKEERGYINRLDFKVNDVTAAVEDHPQHIDIVKLILPAPLAPGQKCTITTPFHVKLPFNFSRGGHDGQSYQATQWYPKPAVYDSKGWHPMPYLDQGEFYSEFGSFDVRITVPKNYVVAATGELQDAAEKDWLKTRSSFSWEPGKEKSKTKSGEIKNILQTDPPSDRETKTLQYKQNNVHDFAWFADKRFIVNYDSCRLASGRVIDVFTYYTPKQKKFWQGSVKFCKDAVRFYSSRIGEYPFNIVQAVQGPESFGGGMEYPTITVISPPPSAKELDLTIAHEVGHNWFYGILASNERDHPWMDEGINSYYDQRYAEWKYASSSQEEKNLLETMIVTKRDQPIETSSEKFSEVNYDLIAYYKTSVWMRYLESRSGIVSFNKAMQEYFQHWQFKHPQPEDFKNTIAESTGKNVDSFFSYLNKPGLLPNQQRSGSKIVFLFHPKIFSSYQRSSEKNIFLFGPAIGFNSYDKQMIGGFLTNYKLPPSPFQFFVAPMYGIKSKRLSGIGTAHYSFYPEGHFRKIDLFLNGATFTNDNFTDTAGKTLSFAFQKIVPGIKLTWKEKDPRSTFHRFIQWKTFLIGEDGLRFYRDTVINGIDTTIYDKYKTLRENRVLNQLRIVMENNRALYPYSGELKIEQANGFIRTAFTGKYFFNYPKGGGLDVRLFAGKFFYTSSKTINKQFETSRYHLNMTGASGYEDYTYSDYFIGRNKFDGAASQQIVTRDGDFKVRTDLLADKVGKTDDWLLAANFSSSIPPGINPLNLLPVKIPVKLFADVGTYADAWKKNAGLDRFLFDAGLHISLLNETINIYIPLIYSGAYKDYIKSAVEKKRRLLRVISFSIDISNFRLRKIDRNLSFLDE